MFFFSFSMLWSFTTVFLNQTLHTFLDVLWHLEVGHLNPEVSQWHLMAVSSVIRVTVVIDMHFYSCIQDIIETIGLSKFNYNSSKLHYWTIMANWPHRDLLLESCRGCLHSLKCTYELIKTRQGGRRENEWDRLKKTGFSAPDVSLIEYIMQ